MRTFRFKYHLANLASLSQRQVQSERACCLRSKRKERESEQTRSAFSSFSSSSRSPTCWYLHLVTDDHSRSLK